MDKRMMAAGGEEKRAELMQKVQINKISNGFDALAID
jgi:hypothetical protein